VGAGHFAARSFTPPPSGHSRAGLQAPRIGCRLPQSMGSLAGSLPMAPGAPPWNSEPPASKPDARTMAKTCVSLGPGRPEDTDCHAEPLRQYPSSTPDHARNCDHAKKGIVGLHKGSWVGLLLPLARLRFRCRCTAQLGGDVEVLT